ncbi:MAG TPA: hypothetical protein H9837_11415 [Candidatus Brachybacterium merdigallinarum]|nr:hypothetical protein [Candidatus Brachybacterium merdigallinarum]
MIRSNRDPRQRAEQEVRGLFAEDSALQEGISWARGALTAAGVDPGSQQLRAIRVLRESDQRLSLIAARYLVDAAAGKTTGARAKRSGTGPLTM